MLRRKWPLSAGDATSVVVTVMGAAVVLIVAAVVLAGRAVAGWRGLALIAVALIGGAPGAAVAGGIRSVASRMELDNHARCLEELVELRRLLRRLVAALGTLVTLSTLALGAALRMKGALTLPTEAVVIFGASGSLLVGLAYGPANTTIRRAGDRLARLIAPFEMAQGHDLVARAEDRQKIDQILGLDQNMLTDLQSGIVVLAPLLASAATVFLPK
jgi:hypothetical protein